MVNQGYFMRDATAMSKGGAGLTQAMGRTLSVDLREMGDAHNRFHRNLLPLLLQP